MIYEYDNLNDRSNLPLLYIPSEEPVTRNANDWHDRFVTVRDTFSSRVDLITDRTTLHGDDRLVSVLPFGNRGHTVNIFCADLSQDLFKGERGNMMALIRNHHILLIILLD